MTAFDWNPGSGSWNDAGDWTPNGVPTSSDTVEFISAHALGTYTISGSGSAADLMAVPDPEYDTTAVVLAGTFDVGAADVDALASVPYSPITLVIAAGASLAVTNTLSVDGCDLLIYGTVAEGNYEASSESIRSPADVLVSGTSAHWITSGTLETSNGEFARITLEGGAFAQADVVVGGFDGSFQIDGSSTLIGVDKINLALAACLIDSGAFVEAPSVYIGGSNTTIDNGTLIGTDNITLGSLEIQDGGVVNAPIVIIEAGNDVMIDTASALTADSITLDGTLTVDPGTRSGSSNTLILPAAITVQDAAAPLLVASPGATLDVTGAISGADTSRLNIDGVVVLAGADNSYYGGLTVGADCLPSTLVLAARGAVGYGAITLTGSADALYIEQNASGNPNGTTSVIAQVGLDTIFAANTSVFACEGRRCSFLLLNGDAASTVLGGSGSETVFGSSGGGLFFGGMAGNNQLLAGGGAATLVGAGNGDQLWANGPVGDLLVAASGNETLGAGNSTSNNVLFGGTGNDMIAADAGDTVIAGSGTPTIFGGRNTVIFAGSGSDLIALGSGPDYVQMGTGNATIFAGPGSDLFSACNGQAGGNDLIVGFNTSDHILLGGYPVTPNITSRGSNTIITLSDDTHITLVGISSLAPNSII